MALTIARTESQLSATTAFQAMDNLMASTVSSSFVVPSGVSRLVSVEIATTADASEEYGALVRFAGNGMADGEQYVAGAALRTRTLALSRVTLLSAVLRLPMLQQSARPW